MNISKSGSYIITHHIIFRHMVSVIGVLVATISIFVPWFDLKVIEGTVSATIYGFNFWYWLGAAVLILFFLIISLFSRLVTIPRISILLLSAGSIYLAINEFTSVFVFQIVDVRIGPIGLVAGFVLSSLGTFFLKKRRS